MGERVAITGATGLIGRAVAAALVDRGYEVVVLARDPRAAREKVPAAAGYLDYQQGRSIDLTGVDHVVNLAGESLFRPFTGRRHLDRVTRQRIAGTAGLAGARTLINASSVGVYGFGRPSDEEVDEHTAPLPGHYAEGSAAWEAAADADRVVLLRMGYVLAPDGGGLPYQVEQARKGKAAYFAPGTQWLPWIHRDDVVAFVLLALAEDRWRGAYNLVAPEAVRSREFAVTLAEVLGAPPPRSTPALFARLFLGAGAATLLGGRRVVPAALCRAGYRFVHPALADALRASVG